MGFNFDGRSAADVVIGAVGADRWEVEIVGQASHAGGAPERGICATMILARGTGGRARRRLVRQGREGRAQGHQQRRPGRRRQRRPAGDATNVVTDYVQVRGESRSHDAKFFKEITAAYKTAFVKPPRR